MIKPYQVVKVSCLSNQVVDLTLHTQRLALGSILLLVGEDPSQSLLHSLQVISCLISASAFPGPFQQRVVHERPQDGEYQVLLSPHQTQGNLTGQSERALNTNWTKGIDLIT